MENKHTYREYKFPNGETIKCTVAFKFLLKLREQNKKIYKKLNDGILNGIGEDLMDSVSILYGAYICGCYAGENGGEESIMNESDFIEKIEDDIAGVFGACLDLISKKKN